MDPQRAYAEAATATSNPDRAGYLLYHAVVKDCRRMEEAYARQDWGALVQAGEHALRILAALHDIGRTDIEAGQLFRTAHRWAWTTLGEFVRDHDLAKLQEVRTWTETLAHQLLIRMETAVTA